MNLARTYRTVRHLTARQWMWRFVCRGKFVAMEKWPLRARTHFLEMLRNVPLPDAASPRLAQMAVHVKQLQRAVHGASLDGIQEGCFKFLNREIDFNGIGRVEWRRELGEKNNPLWRMNLAYMGYLVPLFERDPRVALSVTRSLLYSMTEQNPWSARGVFRDVWHPYTVSHRVINLLTCLHLLENSGVQEDGARQAMLNEIRLGAAFLLGNQEKDLQYNHLLKNVVCFAMIAGASDGASRFALRARGDLERLIRQQYLPDGGHAERAPMYHLLSILDLRILRDSGAFDPQTATLIGATVQKAEEAVNGMIHSDGDVALFNDSWTGEAPRAVELVESAKANPTEPLKIELPDTGYARLAQGGDNLVMDFGACGPDDNPGHAHADFLSLELSISGRRAIVDPGVPTYTKGELRNQSRSAHWHNGPSLADAEPIEFWGSFRVGRRGYAHRLPLAADRDRSLTFAAWQSGYSHVGVIAGRAVRLIPGEGLLIADAWAGAAGHPEGSHFLVAEDWIPLGELRFRCEESGISLRFNVIEGEVGAVEQASHWLRFGKRSAASRVSLSPTSADPIRVAGLWLGWGDEGYSYSEAWLQLRSSFIHALNDLPAVQAAARKSRNA
jgi:hypothetical protein